MKECKCCLVSQPCSNFSKAKTNKDGLRNYCKVCTSAKAKTYYASNVGMYKAKSAEVRSKTKDKIKERSRRYYVANKALINAKTAEYYERNSTTLNTRYKPVAQQWRQQNRPKVNAAASRYRAAKLQALPSWANAERIEDIYADAQRRGSGFHVDHIIPLQSESVCGLHCEANLMILCAKDNQVKGNRTWPDMWEHPKEN